MLSLRGITKTFPGVLANDHVTLEVRSGEVHALLGENGAGKTTLMSILYGIHQPDAGEIRLRGRRVHIRSPRDAIGLGIGMVPQHFLLIRRHTVAENIALGLPGERFVRPARRIEPRVRELGARYGLAVDPRAAIWQLSPSEQQRVEILKALIRGAQALILDEPTSVLTPQEVRGLFDVLRRMKQEGHAVIFISHKLDEVTEIADRVTVLRRGRVVATLPIAETDKRSLARLMVGRDVEFQVRKAPRTPDGDALVADNLVVLSDRGLPALRGISFSVRRGEILGIAGIAGNGQRELVEVITGLRPARSGRVRLLDHEVTNLSARALHEAGVAHIPEDRMLMGIVPAMSVAENLVLKQYRYPPFSRGPVIDRQAIAQFARRMIAEYEIVTPGSDVPARLLSGGNIQKLILSRELSGRPEVIVASHPTAGLDVSATEQIHTVLLQRRQRGAAILLVSEDLDEILALADRIGVLFSGEIVGIVSGAEADRERLGLMMTGQRV
ncbi:MAG: ABC transporter ATP-binding protein [Armatimonadetes bacterium]|nr:ABC transporter ATP-binding protein [Armatimonadota bacterium]